MAARRKQSPQKLAPETTESEVVEEETATADPTPVVETPEPATIEESAPATNWAKVPSLSDDELTVEAVNIQAFQRNTVLLRFRVDGKLTGQIEQLQHMQFKKHDGTIKSR